MTALTDRPQTALLVIDVQQGVLASAHRRDDVVNNVRRECKDVVDALLVDNTSPPETTTLAAPVRTRFDKRVRACWRGCTRFSCSRVLVAVAVSVLRSPVCLPSCAPCVLHVRRTCRSL